MPNEINVELLDQIIQAIDREPEVFDMVMWAKSKPWRSGCGTTACIAGHAVAIGDKVQLSAQAKFDEFGDASTYFSLERPDPKEPVHIEDKAIELLGLSGSQSRILFYVSHWGDFEQPYYDATSYRERADVAIARIQHFITTNGEE
ncbi:hypothetical protein K9N68_37550 (plasmid) [Kovacikia minuta CCNUW1]|uniref:hypothetical protein n=1 Tax=Kovacikia minuta TaxID=2931930 RepID=UPI001CCB3286|nr:hypothetical protein [Kovacikia minuta]UBF29919.1 hypothetical protein K9N68_37550 [Kovacikia minuta CCNUW1]